MGDEEPKQSNIFDFASRRQEIENRKIQALNEPQPSATAKFDVAKQKQEALAVTVEYIEMLKVQLKGFRTNLDLLNNQEPNVKQGLGETIKQIEERIQAISAHISKGEFLIQRPDVGVTELSEYITAIIKK